MNYSIILKNPAKRFIKKLDKHIKKRIIKKIKLLEKNPEAGIRLGGNLKGLWKLREGDYRIIYQIIKEEIVIYILNIGNRGGIYKK